jgi:chromosome segregation protein
LADLHIEVNLETIRQAHVTGDQVNGRKAGCDQHRSRPAGSEIRLSSMAATGSELRLVQLAAKPPVGHAPGRRSCRVRNSRPGLDAEENRTACRAKRRTGDQLPGRRRPRCTKVNNEQRVQTNQVQQQIQVLAADQRNVKSNHVRSTCGWTS